MGPAAADTVDALPAAGVTWEGHLCKVTGWLDSVHAAPWQLLQREAVAANQGLALAFCVSRLRALSAVTAERAAETETPLQRKRGGRAAVVAAQQEAYLQQLLDLEKAALRPRGEGTARQQQLHLQQQQLNLDQVWELLDAEAAPCIRRARKRLRRLRRTCSPFLDYMGAPVEGVSPNEVADTGSLSADEYKQQKQQRAVARCLLSPEAVAALQLETDVEETGEETGKNDSGEEETGAMEADDEIDTDDDAAAEAAATDDEEGEEDETEETDEDASVDGGDETAAPPSDVDEGDTDAADVLLDELEDEERQQQQQEQQKDRQQRQQKDASKKKSSQQLDDEFFSLEEMHRFVAEAEQQEEKRRERQQQQQGGSVEGSEVDDEDGEAEAMLLYEGIDPSGDSGASLSYSALYGNPKKQQKQQQQQPSDSRSSSSGSGSSSEEEETEGEGRGFASVGPLDAEDRRLEKELDRLQALMEEEDKARQEMRRHRKPQQQQEGEQSSSEDEVIAAAAAASAAAAPPNSRKLVAGSAAGATAGAASASAEAAGDKSLAALAARVEALEDELVAPKSWEYTGEAWARHRAKDALLELEDLTVPYSSQPQQQQQHLLLHQQDMHLGGDEEEDEGAIAAAAAAAKPAGAAALSAMIERIVRGRIEAALFDDVLRKAPPPKPTTTGSNKAGAAAAAAAEEELNMEKPTEGLGDLYARQYQEKVMGAPSQQQQQLNEEKRQLLELFGRIMYKCDALTNFRFVPRPVAAAAAAGGKDAPATVRVEEAVPVFIPLDRSGKGSLPKTPKSAEETSREERRAERRSRKARRKKQLRGRIDSGELTLQQARERQLHLQQKNKRAKVEKKHKKQTGLTHAEALKELRRGQKRVKTIHLLADAARARAQKTSSNSKN